MTIHTLNNTCSQNSTALNVSDSMSVIVDLLKDELNKSREFQLTILKQNQKFQEKILKQNQEHQISSFKLLCSILGKIFPEDAPETSDNKKISRILIVDSDSELEEILDSEEDEDKPSYSSYATVKQYADAIGIASLEEEDISGLERMATKLSKTYQQKIKYECSDDYTPIGYYFVPILAEIFAKMYSENYTSEPVSLSDNLDIPIKTRNRNMLKFN